MQLSPSVDAEVHAFVRSIMAEWLTNLDWKREQEADYQARHQST
jgi:hypothetical protein